MGEKINRGLLIELVRSEPGLWNKWDKFYNNRDIKPDLWDKIGKSLNTTGKVAQKSWSTLRDSYKKIQKRVQSGKTSRKYVSWPHYNAMCFLDDMSPQSVTPRENYLSPKHEPPEELFREKPTDEDSLEEREEEDDDCCFGYDEPKSGDGTDKRKRKPGDDQGGTKRKLQLIDGQGKIGADADDDYMFLMSLLPYLRKLDDVQKMRLRIEILRSVTEELENSKYQEASASSWHHAAFVMTQEASTSDSNYPHRATPAPTSGTAPT